MGEQEHLNRQPAIARRFPVAIYFFLTFMVSWSAALGVALPRLLRGEALPKLTGILMFPAMLLGPSLCGIAMTWRTEGRDGVRDLFGRMLRWRLHANWYLLLFLPPVLVLIVLNGLRRFASPDYAPNLFLVGILFGVPAGLLEEIGWTGFAFPQLWLRRSALASGIVLGLLWSLWHLPVIDFLGTASPHGAYWLRYFLAFAAAMTAMRVIICWAYANTGSLLLAQCLHISSTGSLVIFSPPRANAGQEAFWYVIYAMALWTMVAIIAVKYGTSLRGRSYASRLERPSAGVRRILDGSARSAVSVSRCSEKLANPEICGETGAAWWPAARLIPRWWW